MDDIIIYSKSWEDHVGRARQVLRAFRKAGLTANLAKCKRVGSWLEFLGHIFGEGGVSIPIVRAAAIADYVPPATK